MRRRSSSVPHVPDPIIDFVGSYAEGLAIDGSGTTRTLTFGGNLTGGLASSPVLFDVGFLWVGHKDDGGATLNVPDWTHVETAFANDTQESTVSLYRRTMPNPAPTSAVISVPDGFLVAAGVHFFRDVNAGIPIAVAAQIVETINSGKVNPAAISTANPEVFTFAVGAASGTEVFQSPGNGYFLDDLTNSELDGFTVADSGGHHQMAAGYSKRVRDPAEWGGGGTDTRCAAAAITIGINPNE
jgi:hypothetical protein